jgi:diacylglycerol kinase (ATP)
MHEAFPPHQPTGERRQFRALDRAKRKVLLLVNRKAGSGRRREVVDQVAAALGEAGFPATILSTIDQLRDQATEFAAQGDLRAVVAAGGDGTFGAALNVTPAGTPLVILPMGTENLLGRYAGYTRDPHHMVRLLQEGVVAPLDAGKAGERLFAMMLSAGFDAEVVRRVHGGRRGNITHLAYAAPIWSAVMGYRHPPFELHWTDPEGEEHRLESRWLFALNLPRYALQIPIAPHACGVDGMVDVCAFRHGSLAAGLRYLAHVCLHRHHRLPDVTTLRTSRLKLVASPEDQIPFQLDGDPGGFLPVDINVVPSRMNMLVGRAVAEAWGMESATADQAPIDPALSG